jgi:hypothetical protein
MALEHSDDWVKVVQIPLPSFPGKDEALYVFQRGARAPPLAHEDSGALKPIANALVEDA